MERIFVLSQHAFIMLQVQTRFVGYISIVVVLVLVIVIVVRVAMAAKHGKLNWIAVGCCVCLAQRNSASLLRSCGVNIVKYS